MGHDACKNAVHRCNAMTLARSRFRFLLLLTCCVTPAYTAEPHGALGAGTMSCESYLSAVHATNERSAVEAAAAAREWVRGYFAGRSVESTRTVGGSLGNDNFQDRKSVV